MTEHRAPDGEIVDNEEEEEVIYIDPSMDLLPPRPRFIPCIPESCFSFCFPASLHDDEEEHARSDEDDTLRATREKALEPGHTKTSNSLTSIDTKGNNSNTTTTTKSLYLDNDYMEEIPRLTSIPEDGDEESSSEEGSSSAVATVADRRLGTTNLSSPRSLLLHHYQNGQLPIELWIKLCQFLFSLLLMDRMEKFQLVHKKLLTTTATATATATATKKNDQQQPAAKTTTT